MIRIIDGDLMRATEDIIGHQVNCQGKMGSGVAKQIREQFPRAYELYMQRCVDFKNNPNLMLGDCVVVDIGNGKFIANLFGQDRYGYDGKKYTDENALGSSLVKLRECARIGGYAVALPYKIGCDRGGADWDNVVFPMIGEIFGNYGLTLYRYKG